MLSVIKASNIDFMRVKPAFALSWLVILAGIGYGFSRGKDVLAVDFLGGDAVTFSFKQKPSLVEIRDALKAAGIADAQIVPKLSPAGGIDTVQVTVPFGDGAKVQSSLPGALPNAGLEVTQVDRKGPSVGAEIQLSAVKSVVLAVWHPGVRRLPR